MRLTRFARCIPQPQGKYDAWSVLGLRPGTAPHELRDRYHVLMQQYHPEMASDGTGDMDRMEEIDKAYCLIAQAPTNDARYRNLVTDTQFMYYKFLPRWMSKNIDDMPRYWSWARWRFDFSYFLAGCGLLSLILGKVSLSHPRWVTGAAVAFCIDVVLHTAFFPMVMVGLFFRILGERQPYSLAWFQSPKMFLRRSLEY